LVDSFIDQWNIVKFKKRFVYAKLKS
jgi:hypothetical protein